MSIYAKLKTALGAQDGETWEVSFAELERLIGASLPASAFRYPGWWSNNPSNNAMTKIWLNAGWRTGQVDIAARTLVFRRVGPEDQDGVAIRAQAESGRKIATQIRGLGDRPRAFEGLGQAPEIKAMVPPETKSARRRKEPRQITAIANVGEAKAPGAKVAWRFEDLYGCMKGTVTIPESVDLMEPTGEDWEAVLLKSWDEFFAANKTWKD